MENFLAKMEQRLAEIVGFKTTLEEKKIQLQTLKVSLSFRIKPYLHDAVDWTTVKPRDNGCQVTN